MAPALSEADAATSERDDAPAAAAGRSTQTIPVASYTYWAFISYSHTDEPHAKWLHQSLEGYRIPKALRGQATRFGPVPTRLYPVFRDREELAAAPRLGERIERVLEQSRFLIVICSPASAASPWVNKEIEFFKSLGREDYVLCLIVDGEPNASEKPGRERDECFPRSLRLHGAAMGLLTTTGAEPLAADARPNKDGRPVALLKLIAGMLGVSFDSLRQRDLEQRTSRMRRIVAASGLLVIVFGALAMYALYQQQVAEERSRVALSRQLAVQSRSLQETSADLPLLLSLEALFAEQTVEAKRSLFEALTAHRRPISLLRSPTGTSSNAMVVTPDGKQLITGGDDGDLIFFDLTAQGTAPAIQKGHSDAINALSLSADGELLASAGVDGAILFWDLRTRQPSQRIAIPRQQSEVTAVQFGPRDLFAFGRIGADEFGEVVLWNLSSARPVTTLGLLSDGAVTSLAFSPDGNSLATAAVGGDTTLWDLVNLDQLHSDFLKDTSSLAFSPDGRLLASGSWSLTVRQVSDFEPTEFPLPDAPTHISAVEFTADGAFLASAAWSGNVIVWDVETGMVSDGPFALKIGSIRDMALAPDGRTLFASGDDGQVAIVEFSATPLGTTLDTGSYVHDLVFEPANGRLVTALADGRVASWDVVTLTQIRATTVAQPDAPGALAVSPDGGTIASGSIGGLLAFWSGEALQQAGPALRVAGDHIERLAFSPDGATLAIVPLGSEVRFWDIAGGQLDATVLPADEEFVRDAAFAAGASFVVTAGDEGKIKQWDWPSGRQVGSPMDVGVGVGALALSPDGGLLAVGDYNGRVTLWDVERQAVVGVPMVAHSNIVRTVAFSPDGQYVASGGDDGAVVLLDVSSRRSIAQFRHGATVMSGDGTARLARSVNRVAFSLSGKLLAADGPENTIMLWDIDLASWKRQACRIANRNLSEVEWRRYLGDDIPHQETCPDAKPRLEAAKRAFAFW